MAALHQVGGDIGQLPANVLELPGNFVDDFLQSKPELAAGINDPEEGNVGV